MIRIPTLASLVSFGFSFVASTAFASGEFVGGNTFEYRSATGDVSVHCPATGSPSGPSYANFRCYGYSFSPGDAAQFKGPKLSADEVELTATRADGSTRTKKSNYDGTRGISTDAFNLWIDTVFQKPLLKIGRNDIRWTLKRGGRAVQTGSFIAEVIDRGDLSCPYASETSWDPQDCVSSSRVCSDYFYRYGNQCR